MLGYQPPPPPPRPQRKQIGGSQQSSDIDWSKLGPVGSLMSAMTPTPEAQKQLDQQNRSLVSGLFGGGLDGIVDQACMFQFKCCYCFYVL